MATVAGRRIVEGSRGVRPDLEAVSADVRQYRHLDRQRARRAIGAVGSADGTRMPAAVSREADAGPRRPGAAPARARVARIALSTPAFADQPTPWSGSVGEPSREQCP